jgi:hypothetical protein
MYTEKRAATEDRPYSCLLSNVFLAAGHALLKIMREE